MAVLYYTIGIPGCGKSSYYKNNLKKDVIHISSDKLREELLGDVNNQSNNSLIFNEMTKRTIMALRINKSVYFDATNLNRKKRINLLKQLPPCKKIAIVFAIPFAVCCERNNSRDRTVPQFVMNKMYKNFQPPHYDEGFDEIRFVHHNKESEIESLEYLMNTNIKCNHDNPHHKLSCGMHCILTHEEIINLIKDKNLSSEQEEILVLAGLYHDLSKFKCKVFYDCKGNVSEIAHYYNHENVSSYDYLCAESYNKVDNKILVIIANLIANHMVFYAGEDVVKARKKIYNDEFWKLLEILHEADVKAH